MAAAELAVGAINGTGWPISESSLRTSTNCRRGCAQARSPPCLSDFEHGHRVEGDVDCASRIPRQSVRCGFGQETFAVAAGNGQDAPKIGIGGHLTAPPLPHHRAYGSRTRRVDWVKLGQEHE